MKHIYTTLLLLFVSVALVEAQSTPSSCEGTDSLKSSYHFDATKLAIRELYNTSSPDTASIVVNTIYTEEIMKALLAVHQANGLPERDEVIDFYRIHALESPSTNRFLLYADTAENWVQEWKNADILTEVEAINILVDSFGLFFPTSPKMVYDEAVGKHLLEVDVQSSQHLNLQPLLAKFLEVDGIVSAEETQFHSEEIKKDIQYEINTVNNYVDLTYSYGWGNCSNGCENEHFWIFRVYLSDCAVLFLSDGGNPLVIKDIEQISQISVTPNPTYGPTSIKLVGPAKADFRFRLHDSVGRLIQSEYHNFHNGLVNLQIDLFPLPVGVYFVTFSQGDQVLTKRILKK